MAEKKLVVGPEVGSQMAHSFLFVKAENLRLEFFQPEIDVVEPNPEKKTERSRISPKKRRFYQNSISDKQQIKQRPRNSKSSSNTLGNKTTTNDVGAIGIPIQLLVKLPGSHLAWQ